MIFIKIVNFPSLLIYKKKYLVYNRHLSHTSVYRSSIHDYNFVVCGSYGQAWRHATDELEKKNNDMVNHIESEAGFLIDIILHYTFQSDSIPPTSFRCFSKS